MTERHVNDGELLVTSRQFGEGRAESWDVDGRALVLVPEEGRLVVATDRPGFLRVERHEEPQVRGVLPGGNWRLRQKEGPSKFGHRVVAFLVYDTYVRPVSALPSTKGRWRTNAGTHHLFQSD
ncbi:hypothetical protein [Streptomyces beigongshangae]|uniref:hypothetical protein n=1 Tax=Streptomyces beigongshangae TaxID=2841597 RepID=UPI001C85E25A|nr:hypothetical protein [Streptomyces sp. REN17]